MTTDLNKCIMCSWDGDDLYRLCSLHEQIATLTARLAAAEAERKMAGLALEASVRLKDDYRDKLAAAEAERDEARRFLAAAHVALSEVAPCGHYNRFIEWEDHSKPIACVKCKLDAAEAAAQWCWVRLGDADYDLACVKWPWLNASSVVLHTRAAKAGGLE